MGASCGQEVTDFDELVLDIAWVWQEANNLLNYYQASYYNLIKSRKFINLASITTWYIGSWATHSVPIYNIVIMSTNTLTSKRNLLVNQTGKWHLDKNVVACTPCAIANFQISKIFYYYVNMHTQCIIYLLLNAITLHVHLNIFNMMQFSTNWEIIRRCSIHLQPLMHLLNLKVTIEVPILARSLDTSTCSFLQLLPPAIRKSLFIIFIQMTSFTLSTTKSFFF